VERPPLEPGAAARAARITAAVEKLDWANVSRRLERYAFTCTKKRSKELAADVAQTAITQVLDPFYMEWDPDKVPDLFDHLKNVVRGIVSNRRRTRRTTGEIATDDEELDEMATSPEPDPETALADRDAAANVMDRMTRALAGDALALKLVALLADGIESPTEQAEAAGASYDDVRNARKRMFRASAEIARELGLKSEDDDGR
jgi:DNA-directed RNA polymerase specialized sigma24 family protein